MMKDIFNDFSWHDAELEFVNIDRKKPGEQDTVSFSIIWPEGNRSIIEFFDCYALQMNMNFGIVATETILSAECITDSEEIDCIRNKWSKGGVNLDNLK